MSTSEYITQLLEQQVQPNDYAWILLNFALCAILGFGLRSFYLSHAQTITGKTHIASILPILACIVFLVILIVKSSLALSLGLVGALSIVRFRTPVKEPEELDRHWDWFWRGSVRDHTADSWPAVASSTLLDTNPKHNPK